MVKSILPDLTNISSCNGFEIMNWLIVLILSGLSALFVARYAAGRYKEDKNKTAVCFIVLTVIFSVLLLCFFGVSAITVKGIILSLIFILSSFEDIKSRECDDYLHLMIVIAAFIGIKVTALPGMLIAAAFVFALLVGTLSITNGQLGGADIKMSVVCTFLLGLQRGLLGLTLGMILAVLFNLFKKKKDKKAGFPLIPYLAVGFMTAFFI